MTIALIAFAGIVTVLSALWIAMAMSKPFYPEDRNEPPFDEGMF